MQIDVRIRVGRQRCVGLPLKEAMCIMRRVINARGFADPTVARLFPRRDLDRVGVALRVARNARISTTQTWLFPELLRVHSTSCLLQPDSGNMSLFECHPTKRHVVVWA